MWCDEVVVLDHCSTDRTPEIITAVAITNPGRVHTLRSSDPTWTEMANHQACLECARLHGATHIARVDADEILTGNCLALIREWIGSTPDYPIMQLPWLQLSGSLRSVHNSGMWASSEVSVAFKDSPELHWAAQGQEKYDFHHRHPFGRQFIPYRPGAQLFQLRWGGLMHLQMVSERRLLAKQYLYQLTERLRWPNRPVHVVRDLYSRTVAAHQSGTSQPVPASWWEPYSDLMNYIDINAEPWQMAECARILKENPGIGQGLNSFGLEF
jgi:glycosyltransferase involved in cell wall biosynthesis